MEICDPSTLKLSPFYSSDGCRHIPKNPPTSYYDYSQPANTHAYTELNASNPQHGYRLPIDVTSAAFAVNQASQLLPPPAWSVRPPMEEKQPQQMSLGQLSDLESTSQWDINDQKLPKVSCFIFIKAITDSNTNAFAD